MRSAAIAIRLPRWEVVLRGVRWRGLAGAVFALLVTAVLIQPPVSNHPAVRAKVDPALSALARALPSRTFPVIVRETRPASTFAEDLVRAAGGRVSRELPLVGGFAARVPGSAVARLSSSPVVWRVWGDAPIRVAGESLHPAPSLRLRAEHQVQR